MSSSPQRLLDPVCLDSAKGVLGRLIFIQQIAYALDNMLKLFIIQLSLPYLIYVVKQFNKITYANCLSRE